jgi:hypothetical protein
LPKQLANSVACRGQFGSRMAMLSGRVSPLISAVPRQTIMPSIIAKVSSA